MKIHRLVNEYDRHNHVLFYIVTDVPRRFDIEFDDSFVIRVTPRPLEATKGLYELIFLPKPISYILKLYGVSV